MIEITHYRNINKNAVKAMLSIKIAKWGNFLIRDITLFEKNSKRWISFPSRKYQDNGQDKYFRYNGFEDQGMNEAFQKKVIEAIDAYLITNPQPQDPLKEVKYQDDEEGIPF